MSAEINVKVREIGPSCSDVHSWPCTVGHHAPQPQQTGVAFKLGGAASSAAGLPPAWRCHLSVCLAAPSKTGKLGVILGTVHRNDR